MNALFANLDPETLIQTTKRPPLSMERGEGSWLWDHLGNAYLDFLQGWAVNALGHCAPEIRAALVRQSSLLLTPSPAFHNTPQLQLAQLLTHHSGLDQVVFCNSGAEANEVAVKLARKWGQIHKQGAHKVVCTQGAFHGRTLAMMSASGKPAFHRLFPPLVPGFVHVPFDDVGAVEHAIDSETVAVMIEPIQGEGGVVVPSDSYLTQLRALTQRAGILLLVDEIQTGMGRTGKLFDYQWQGVQPDIVTVGKGLGSGFPLSATLVRRDVNCLLPGDHGGTYGGNPLACAVGTAVTRVIADEIFLNDVVSRGQQLHSALLSVACDVGAQVRGRGLLQALVLPGKNAAKVSDRCFALGLLVNAAQPNVLRFAPSLRVSAGEIDGMREKLARALAES